MNATILKCVILLSLFNALHNTSLPKNISKSRKVKKRSSPYVFGIPARPNQFPYAVYLQEYIPVSNLYDHICTFSLITTQSILGAANCVVMENGQVKNVTSFRGILGTVDSYNITNEVTFKEFRPFPNFNSEPANDIAIAILSKRVKLGESIKTIPIVRRNYALVRRDVDMRIVGWGFAISNGECKPRPLLYLNVKILPNIECESYSSLMARRMRASLGDQTFCYGSIGRHPGCIGFFGGLVIGTFPDEQKNRNQYRDALIGINPYVNQDCADRKTFSLITGVYENWINSNTVGKVEFRSFRLRI